MPVGCGMCSVGLSVSGYGSVDAATAPTQTILIDANSGLAQNARKIDAVKGQYVYDTLGRVQGMPGVQQLVLMRIATLLDSSAVKGLGLAAPSGVVGANVVRRLTEELSQALKDLVNAKIIQIVDVRVEKAPNSSVRRYLVWRDLTAGVHQAGSEIRTDF